MNQYFVVVFFALGYLEFSNAIHRASRQYIGCVNPLLNLNLSPENMAASVAQFSPDLSLKTYAMLNTCLAMIEQYENNIITKSVKEAKTVYEFLQELNNSETSTDSDPWKRSISEAVIERLYQYSPPKDNPQLVEIAVASIKEVGDEAREEFQKYLTNALDLLEKYPSNVSYKVLTKIDLLLSFYERTKGTGSFPSPSEISDEDEKLAADVPKIMNSLAADFGIFSAVAEVLASAGTGGDN